MDDARGSTNEATVGVSPVALFGRPRPRWVGWVAWAVMGGTLCVLYAVLGRVLYGGDSDFATLALQGKSLASGNVLLHGWTFQLDSFWTIDVPFYAVAVSLVGVRFSLLFVVSGVIAGLLVLLCAWLATQGRRPRGARVAILVIAAFLALPVGRYGVLLLRGGWHAGTVLFCMAAFALVSTDRRGGRRVSLMVASVLLALGIIGDLQTVPLALAPLVGGGVVAALRTRRLRAAAPYALITVVASAGAALIHQLLGVAGGYQVGRANPHAHRLVLVANLHRLPKWLQLVFGFHPAGHDGYGTPALALATRVVVTALVVLAVLTGVSALIVGAIRGRLSHNGPDVGGTPDWVLNDLLVLACLADVAFYSYAALGDDPGFLRYLMPFAVFGSLLASRQVGRLSDRLAVAGHRAVASTAALLCLMSAIGVGGNLLAPPAPVVNGVLVAALESRGLHRGLGWYWAANASTVSSDERVVIRAVDADSTHRLHPRVMLTDQGWFRGPFQFVVVPRHGTFNGVDRRSASLTFGPPQQTLDLSAWTVLIWNHPLYLSKQS